MRGRGRASELRGGQRRAPEGGWPEGGAAGSAGAWGVWRGTGSGGRRGNTEGREVEWGAVFGNWGSWGGGEAFSVTGYRALAGHSMHSGGVVLLTRSRETLSIAPGMVQPFLPGPLILQCHFLISLLHFKKQKNKKHQASDNVLIWFLTALAGEEKVAAFCSWKSFRIRKPLLFPRVLASPPRAMTILACTPAAS